MNKLAKQIAGLIAILTFLGGACVGTKALADSWYAPKTEVASLQAKTVAQETMIKEIRDDVKYLVQIHMRQS